MNLVRCENGHFYDNDTYTQCPHCGAQNRNEDLTIPLTQPVAEDSVTSHLQSLSLADAVQQATAGTAAAEVSNDSATVGYYDKSMGLVPVVGWLVCTEGKNLGTDYRLKSGRNFIGRATNMDVSIAGDETVSREKHAVVVYEPKSHIFLVQAGESKELCYLNDKVVLATEQIKTNDVLTIGATKLMFFPCCSDQFNWEMFSKEEE